MAGVKQVIVECIRGGDVIARYPFGVAVTLGPTAPPPHNDFVNQAKSNLTSEGIAFPPYAGITFNVMWPP